MRFRMERARDAQAVSLLVLGLLATACAIGTGPEAVPVLAERPTLPLRSSDFEELAPRPALAVADGIFETQNGQLTLVFEQLSPDGSHGSILWTHTTDERKFSAPEELPVVPATLVASASAVHSSDGQYLYFLASSGLTEPVALYRARFLAETFSSAEEVDLPEGVSDVLSWPTFHALDDGTVAAVYRTADRFLALSRSENGHAFSPPVILTDYPVAMPAIAQFANGEIVISYQTTPDEGYGKQSWIRISSQGGERWSAPHLVTSESKNVHDTALVRRLDGGIDLYFAQTNGEYTGGFSLFRRSLDSDGRLGSIERLSMQETGSLLKPYVFRTSSGKLLLVTSKKLGSDRRQLLVADLDRDAPGHPQSRMAKGGHR